CGSRWDRIGSDCGGDLRLVCGVRWSIAPRSNGATALRPAERSATKIEAAAGTPTGGAVGDTQLRPDRLQIFCDRQSSRHSPSAVTLQKRSFWRRQTADGTRSVPATLKIHSLGAIGHAGDYLPM